MKQKLNSKELTCREQRIKNCSQSILSNMTDHRRLKVASKGRSKVIVITCNPRFSFNIYQAKENKPSTEQQTRDH